MTEQTDFFQKVLSEKMGTSLKIIHAKNLSGGCINQAMKLETSQSSFFVKWNLKSDMFEKEARCLELLRNTGEISIPQVITLGSGIDFSYIILEYIEPAPRQNEYWKNFGLSLGKLHKHSAPSFGLDHDNYIGSLPQYNKEEKKWTRFFVEQRLRPQLDLAIRKGHGLISDPFEKLFSQMEELLPEEKPALLHGDLWSGNVLVNAQGNVSLIDPAVYFGHREAELAYTHLFGAFDDDFYKSYQEILPLEKGYERRVDIYNLYPLLVHVNLFGGSYINTVQSILKSYV